MDGVEEGLSKEKALCFEYLRNLFTQIGYRTDKSYSPYLRMMEFFLKLDEKFKNPEQGKAISDCVKTLREEILLHPFKFISLLKKKRKLQLNKRGERHTEREYGFRSHLALAEKFGEYRHLGKAIARKVYGKKEERPVEVGFSERCLLSSVFGLGNQELPWKCFTVN